MGRYTWKIGDIVQIVSPRNGVREEILQEYFDKSAKIVHIYEHLEGISRFPTIKLEGIFPRVYGDEIVFVTDMNIPRYQKPTKSSGKAFVIKPIMPPEVFTDISKVL